MAKARLLDRSKGHNPVSRQAAYSKAAAHFELALETVVDILKHSKHDSTRLGAANKIIDKVLPDLKSSTFTDDDGNNVPIPIIKVLLDVSRNHSNQKDTTVIEADTRG